MTGAHDVDAPDAGLPAALLDLAVTTLADDFAADAARGDDVVFAAARGLRGLCAIVGVSDGALVASFAVAFGAAALGAATLGAELVADLGPDLGARPTVLDRAEAALAAGAADERADLTMKSRLPLRSSA